MSKKPNTNHIDSAAEEKKATLFVSILIMLLLIAFITLIGLWGMELIRDKAETIVQNRVDKMQNVTKMRASARERTVILQRMILLEDPFDIDDEFLRFNSFGAEFINNRLAFLKHQLDPTEKSLLEKQANISRTAVPLQDKVVDLIIAEETNEAKKILVEQAIPLQDKVITHLSELLSYQLFAADRSVAEADIAYEKGKFWIILIAAIAASIGILIASGINNRAKLAKESREAYVSEILHANEAKSSFLANMSHEIRTPLTAIIGFAEISLTSGQKKEDRLIALKNIANSGKHLLNIINDILDLSKIEADKLEVEQIDMSPIQILEDVKSIVRMQAEEKGLEFKINYTFPTACRINSDPLRIKQILLNLCGNAIKFTKSGSVQINVTTEPNEELLIFDVVDTGIGMNEQQLSRIFNAFTQADSTTTRKFGGTGLGLSLSKQLVAMLGGDITVTSTPGFGSRFRASVKTGKLNSKDLVFNLDKETEQKNDKEKQSTNIKVTGNILLAEDTKLNQTLFTIYLEELGANVTIVENGELAVQFANKEAYDLILMDMQMPVMDGLKATKTLRESAYVKPIVALTANAMSSDKKACFDAGCDDFISKPVDRNHLEEIVTRYLPEDGKKVIDLSPITSNSKPTSDKLDKIRVRFVKEGIAEFLRNIHQSFANDDIEELKREVHKLKGTGGNFGYPILTDLCNKIEFQIENDDKLQIELLIEELNVCYARIIAGLNDRIMINKNVS